MKIFQLIRRCLAGWLLVGLIFASTPALSFTISPLFDLTLELDGVDDYAVAQDHPSLDLGTTGDFTIEVFYYITNPDRKDTDVLVWKKDTYGIKVLYADDGLPDRIVFQINTSSSTIDFVTFDIHLTPGWHHIAAIFDNDYSPTEYLLALYLDGNLVRPATDLDISGIPDTNEPVTIGGNGISNPTIGWIEEIRFSDIIRYTGDTYEVPAAPFEPDEHTRALWHFDEYWGATVFKDASIHANTLTGMNGVQISNPTGVIPPTLPFGKISLADGTSQAEITPTLTWEVSTGAAGYQVCIESDGNDFCDQSWIEAGLETSLISPALDAYTQYRWQVRAINLISTIYADDGEWWSFTTRDIPQAGPDYSVTVIEDASDGLCGIKHCSLREAMAASEADERSGSIELQPDQVFTLNSGAGMTGYGNTAFSITEELVLEGNGSIIERDAKLGCSLDSIEQASEFRLFTVAWEGNLTLNQVTLRNGCSDGDPKIALEAGLGGAIYNQGSLQLSQTTLDHNQARHGGGGLYHNGKYVLQVNRSTFSNNFTSTNGGGLLNNTVATLINSTLSNNSSVGDGGGLYNTFTGYATLDFVTIASNTAEGAGSGVANQGGGILKLQNSLLGSNGNETAVTLDCTGLLTSLGYNLIQDITGCQLTALPSDILNLDPLITPLGNHGGLTFTHSLWATSPAIDRIPGDSNGCGTTVQLDQRGYERPQDAQMDGVTACDIGAVEVMEGGAILTHIYLPILVLSR